MVLAEVLEHVGRHRHRLRQQLRQSVDVLSHNTGNTYIKVSSVAILPLLPISPHTPKKLDFPARSRSP
eukprot:scaffold229863_cov29-Prasinocladus_malaysianus.AAC.1